MVAAVIAAKRVAAIAEAPEAEIPFEIPEDEGTIGIDGSVGVVDGSVGVGVGVGVDGSAGVGVGVDGSGVVGSGVVGSGVVGSGAA